MNYPIHNRILRMFLPLAAAFLVIACGKTVEVPYTPAPSGESVMEFAGRVADDQDNDHWEAASRALDPAGIPSGARFGVIAYKTAGVVWSSAASGALPNLMYNQMVEKTATGAVYSPVRSWSVVPTDKYTFFAYMPYSDGLDNGTGIVMNTSETTKSLPKINFTVQNTVANHVDLLVAQVTDRTPGDYSPVTFTFKHATTRIRFAVAFNANMAGSSVKVTGIRLYGVQNKGILQLGGTTNTTPLWSGLEGNASYTILDKDDEDDDCTLNYSATSTVVTTPGCYMIPQGGQAAQPIVIELDYAVTIQEGSAPYVKTTALSITSGAGWTIGKSMLYTLTLQRTTITFTAKVEDWETVSVDNNEIVLTEEPMI